MRLGRRLRVRTRNGPSANDVGDGRGTSPKTGRRWSQARRTPLVPEAFGSERGRRGRPLGTHTGRSPGSSNPWTPANRPRPPADGRAQRFPFPPRRAAPKVFGITRSGSGKPSPARIHRSIHSCGDSPRLSRFWIDDFGLGIVRSKIPNRKSKMESLAFPFHLARQAPGENLWRV